MKKLNLGNINAGLDNIKELAAENSGIARDELIEASLIDFAAKNTYAADDNDDTIRELADQIEEVGLLNPLGVIQNGERYRLFSGERRYKAITTHLHWDKIPCRVFEGVSPDRAQLMLHVANGGREYTAARKLELYEEYKELLERMKANGEFKGGIQKGIADLLNVSDRQVRNYKVMSEQLTPEEKESVSSGVLTFGDAKAIAVDRERTTDTITAFASDVEKSGTGSAFEALEKPEVSKPEVIMKQEPEVKTGTGSGFEETKAPFEPVQKPNYTPEEKRLLLEKFVLTNSYINCEDLYDYYVEMMPTTQEAISGILKPKYGYSGGTIIGSEIAGHYSISSNKLLLSYKHLYGTISYSFSEMDAVIRELYRSDKLFPQKQKKQNKVS